jgi:hypothetical protein
MKRTLALLIALVLIALVVALWWQSARRADTVSEGTGARSTAPSAVAQELERAPSPAMARVVVPDAEPDMQPAADDSAPAPTLSGRVIDDDGKPAAGAAVFAAPCGRVAPRAGPWSVSPCDADGRFTLELQRDAPHWLWLDDARYVPWHSWQNAIDCVPPATRDLEIRVQRIETTHLHVVDAATRQPIERASLRTVYDRTPPPPGTRTSELESWYGDPFDPRVEYTEQPSDGFAVDLVAPARAVVVRSPGHAPQLAQLLPVSEQTLALEPSGGVRGTLAFADGIARNCLVWLRRERTNTRFDEERDTAADAGVGTAAFEARDLAAGMYELFVSVRDLHVEPPLLVRSKVFVAPGTVTDVGLVEVAAQSASLTVRITCPPGVVAHDLDGELALATDGWPARLVFEPDGDGGAGVFRAAHLPVSRAQVSYPARSPALGRPQSTTVELGGDANELSLDLSTLALCTLDVHVERTNLGGRRLFVVYADGSEHEHVVAGPQGQPFVERVLARGGERVVVEHCTNFGEVVASSAPITLPRTSERAIEVHVP